MKKELKDWRIVSFFSMVFFLLLSFFYPVAVMAGESSGGVSYPENLAHVMAYIGKLKEAQPEVINSFFELHHASVKPGTLDTKAKELIALGIAVAVRCEPCIAGHTEGALKAGATDAQIMEALNVAILMGGGPALAYAAHALEAMEQFKKAEK